MVEDICTHVLILDGGRQRFFGTLDQLRSAYTGTDQSSLEEIFFKAIELEAVESPPSRVVAASSSLATIAD